MKSLLCHCSSLFLAKQNQLLQLLLPGLALQALTVLLLPLQPFSPAANTWYRATPRHYQTGVTTSAILYSC